jgi:hypothetical protein
MSLGTFLALQVHTFYEAVGLMIGAESEAVKRDEYLVGVF